MTIIVDQPITHNVTVDKPGLAEVSGNTILANFTTLDPSKVDSSNPYYIPNFVSGKWEMAKTTYDVVDPLNGEVFVKSSNTQIDELQPFVDNLKKVPKSGLHNPYKRVDRYLLYGSIHQKAAAYLHNKVVFDHFVTCIQRVMPKSYAQAAGEIKILRLFFENFSGDRVRMLCRGFIQPGDYLGQMSSGNRWPYGPVAVISPFNFPLEICIMQLMGALMVGNRAVLKVERRVGLPVEQFMRFLHFCGMPAEDCDFINCKGDVMEELLMKAKPQMIQFTGSTSVAERLVQKCHGRLKIEDAGFDWKILGPDVPSEKYIESVAYQCDQDAYAISGQKCSAQSMVFVHENWMKTDLIERIKKLAERRSLADLTLSPVLSHSNTDIKNHIDQLLKLPGSRVLFGGAPLKGHKIPEQYGSFQPTAVYVPLDSILSSKEAVDLCTTEIFGPLQVVTEYKDSEFDKIIEVTELIPHHLTAAVVSNDSHFIQKALGLTLNGTTYVGIRARTTGAPQNHWFGPAGNPMAAGIGTPEAILSTWTCHREIIFDYGPLPESWSTPSAT